jgi:SAM-dependent methyltransferase
MLSRLFDPWWRAYWRLRFPKTREELRLDEPAILAAIDAAGARRLPCRVDVDDYRAWYRDAGYEKFHPGYYSENLHEKSLEHYLAARLLALKPGEVYIDIASQNGVAAEIYTRLHGADAYVQDLDFPQGLHGRRIGGDAAAMDVPGDFADAMALHCSFEHFEGDSDRRFIREAARVLRPGGRCVIVPLYLCQYYACITYPPMARAGRVAFEPDIKLHAMRSWLNRHGRFYDARHLVERVAGSAPGLRFTVFVIENYAEADPSCYARFALLIEKPASR